MLIQSAEGCIPCQKQQLSRSSKALASQPHKNVVAIEADVSRDLIAEGSIRLSTGLAALSITNAARNFTASQLELCSDGNFVQFNLSTYFRGQV
jgi:hypothetical protein